MYPGSPAELYVHARGLGEVASRFGLGYVDSAMPGHERYQGFLAIPYLRPAPGAGQVATVRFRCIADQCVKDSDGDYFVQKQQKEEHSGHGKYMSLPGDVPRIFNTIPMKDSSSILVVVEGEFDAMTWDLAEVPCMGAPGTGTWRDYWTPALIGYETVYLLAEDAAGLTFMDSLAAKLSNAKVIGMNNADSNSTFLAHGMETLKARIGL
ncbi:topoisomerase [Streptomyces sp. NPDC055036]